MRIYRTAQRLCLLHCGDVTGRKSPKEGICVSVWASQVVLEVKNPFANAGDIRDSGSISGSRRSPGGGHGKPLQYSHLENSMDRGAWQATAS